MRQPRAIPQPVQGMFSKRHYVAVGRAMRDARPGDDAPVQRHAQWLEDLRRLSDMFVRDSAAFENGRWWEYVHER